MKNAFRYDIRVRYEETDAMGMVYYGNYARYLEVVRAEMIRAEGLSYALMEEQGVLMPVLRMNITYRGIAVYDDLIQAKAVIQGEIGKTITYKTELSVKDRLINESEVELIFLDRARRRPVTCPSAFVAALEKYCVL
ncbi:MAG: thioesterase family protein [Bacteroidota bacterium]|nr:thioesterase family protein [Bacteroidota bacterium]MEC8031783.1 thioesterase family protein [Bacteroidota bacterium]MEC8834975.1 thioesterase family protein [Bacteroidota bacterium]